MLEGRIPRRFKENIWLTDRGILEAKDAGLIAGFKSDAVEQFKIDLYPNHPKILPPRAVIRVGFSPEINLEDVLIMGGLRSTLLRNGVVGKYSPNLYDKGRKNEIWLHNHGYNTYQLDCKKPFAQIYVGGPKLEAFDHAVPVRAKQETQELIERKLLSTDATILEDGVIEFTWSGRVRSPKEGFKGIVEGVGALSKNLYNAKDSVGSTFEGEYFAEGINPQALVPNEFVGCSNQVGIQMFGLGGDFGGVVDPGFVGVLGASILPGEGRIIRPGEVIAYGIPLVSNLPVLRPYGSNKSQYQHMGLTPAQISILKESGFITK